MKCRDERGLSQSVQYAVLLPLLLLSTIGIVQAAVWIHGHNVAVRAVNAAADIARSEGGSSGAEAAASRVAQSGGLRDVDIAVSRGAGDVRVDLTARVPMFFDLGLGWITESASAPVERVTDP